MIIDAILEWILLAVTFILGSFVGLFVYHQIANLQDSLNAEPDMISVEECHEWDKQYMDIYEECQLECFKAHEVTGGITSNMLCVCGIPKTIWSVGD